MRSFYQQDIKEQMDTIFSLQLKYRKQGYVDERIKKDAAILNMDVGELCDHIAERKKVVDNQLGEPVSVAVLEPLGGNEDTPTFHLAKVPLEEYPLKLSYSSDNLTSHPLSVRWKNMQVRCSKRSSPAWHNYGGRGIFVCDAWHRLNPLGRTNYIRWLEAELANEGLTVWDKFDVDREDNDEGYSPQNCRVVGRNTNSQNTRFSKLTFHDVVALRKYIQAFPKERRQKILTSKVDEYGCNKYTLARAVSGETWKNVDAVEPPVELGGGNTGTERVLTDDVVIQARARMRECSRDKRVVMLETIAEELGVCVGTMRPYVVGTKGDHLNDDHPPVHTRRLLTVDDINALVKEYEKVWLKETLNHFCIRKSEEVGVTRGGLYDRLRQFLPEYMWRRKRR